MARRSVGRIGNIRGAIEMMLHQTSMKPQTSTANPSNGHLPQKTPTSIGQSRPVIPSAVPKNPLSPTPPKNTLSPRPTMPTRVVPTQPIVKPAAIPKPPLPTKVISAKVSAAMFDQIERFRRNQRIPTRNQLIIQALNEYLSRHGAVQ